MTALIVACCLTSSLTYPALGAAQAPSAMSLAQLVESADQRNPAISAARQTAVAAEARVLLARAGRGPTVTASAAPSVTGGTSATVVQGAGGSASITSTNLPTAASAVARLIAVVVLPTPPF